MAPTVVREFECGSEPVVAVSVVQALVVAADRELVVVAVASQLAGAGSGSEGDVLAADRSRVSLRAAQRVVAV